METIQQPNIEPTYILKSKILTKSLSNRFLLDSKFLERFYGKQPFSDINGYVTFKRTYARYIEDEDRTEEFYEMVKRVVEGTFNKLKKHYSDIHLEWKESYMQNLAQDMYQRMWDFKWSPSGRGLWMMGTEFVEKYGSLSLCNCAFKSTTDILTKLTEPFVWTLDCLMLGVGVGFDTFGKDKLLIQQPKGEIKFEVDDSRKGWTDALKGLLEAYFIGNPLPIFNYNKIRPAGTRIKLFGGISEGAKPLEEMLNAIKNLLETRIGKYLTSVNILDIFDYLAKCVVSGNIRRSALIALGDNDDYAFIDAKLDKKANDDRRWCANHSILAKKGMDYKKIVEHIRVNGEPALIWLENAQQFSQMNGKIDNKDILAKGVNPCITGDTLIAVADGRNMVSIETLAKEKKDIPVYCKDHNGITQIRLMRNPRITGFNEEIYELILDDGSIIKCTKNHKFLLKNGNMCELSSLKQGDSLMLMTKWQTSWDEIMKKEEKNKKLYWMLNDGSKNIFEHSFIFNQLNQIQIPQKFVIHHKDYNGLNNSINNLELIEQEKHQQIHNISENNNPMRKWYKNASLIEKQHYHNVMSNKTQGINNGNYNGIETNEILNQMKELIKKTNEPLTYSNWRIYAKENHLIQSFSAFRGNLLNLIKKANYECGFEHLDNPALMREYKKYIHLLNESDLELIFNNGIWVVKECETCHKSFKVKYGEREHCYCSMKCNNSLNSIQSHKKAIEKKIEIQNQKKKLIYDLFNKYIIDFQKIPNNFEFREYLKENGLSDLRSGGLKANYQQFLNSICKNYFLNSINIYDLDNCQYNKRITNQLIEQGLIYNHKIISIRKIGTENVYNGTVDEFHNYGIILKSKTTNSNRLKIEMIFSANCGEMTLEDGEVCNLGETYPSHHDSYEDYQQTLFITHFYCKIVTLIPTHWECTTKTIEKNRRMGVGQSGIMNGYKKFGRKQMLEWSKKGYEYLRNLDKVVSKLWQIPESIKLTTIKPSGTVSLLAGVDAGIHYPESEYYIRRIRFAVDSDMLPTLKAHGYHIELDVVSPNTMVVDFPSKSKDFLKSKEKASVKEQIRNAIDYQRIWSDNQVSITVTVRDNEWKKVLKYLPYCEKHLKGISFLPLKTHGYKQAPYEAISKKQYEEMSKFITPITSFNTKEAGVGENFCSGGMCKNSQ